MAQYTSVTVAPAAAAELRLFAAQVGGPLGQRVTMTDALRLAVRIATEHLAEVQPIAVTLGIISGEDNPR